jgi:putative isomerase
MKKYSIYLILVLISVFNLKANSKNNRVAENYPQIIDLSFTPLKPTYKGGFNASLFSDAGSWIGFSTPSADKWLNGFCGPFTIDSRFWVSNSIAQIGVEKSGRTLNADQFKRDSICYFPGNLYMSSTCEGVKLEQQLFYINKNHAILQLNSDSVKWNISSTIWLDSVQVTKENNSLVVLLKTGELVTVTFPLNFMLVVTGNSYTATSTNPSKNESVIISFYNNQQEKVEASVKPENLLNSPNIAINQSKERWNGYLTKILRNDMPQAYNRVAVKSVVTLMANWRSAKGDILHDGIIPSNSYASFNGFWAWDSWKHAVALSHFAPNLAKEQVKAMFDYQMDDGMIPDNVFSNKKRINYKDSKPPLAVWAVMEIYNQTKDLEFLKEMFPKLLNYNRWWYSYRDHDQNGICEYGCTNGTLKCARFESGMDNAVRFDSVKVVKNGPSAWSMTQESVDLNAFLYLENKLLKTMSDIVKIRYKHAFDAKKTDDYFYDKVNGYYYDKTTDGKFVAVEGTEAFIPLWTKMASPDKAAAVIKMIQKPNKFSTYIPFPSVCADNPNLAHDNYWRGPVWLDQVYFGISGIRNYGNKELADQYTDKVFTRLKGLTASEPINENYDPHTGKRLRAPNFSWSAAHLLLLYLEYGK